MIEDGIGPGTQVRDYQVLSLLAEGGMGRVFSAVHAPSGLRVALKTVLSRDPGLVAYFRREIATLSGLKHPAIVPFRDHGVHGEEPWYAMDLLEGPTLRDALGSAQGCAQPAIARDSWVRTSAVWRHEDRRGTPSDVAGAAAPSAAPHLSAEELTIVCIHVLRALEYVHTKGVVHGDIKPENIFLRPDSRPVLVDFGIAASFDSPRERLARVPRSLGSVAYMAPERLRGSLPDARADLYAVGCVLYECWTDIHPFLKSTVEATKLAHLRAPVVPPSLLGRKIPRHWEALILRLLAKSPADRPGYARDALEVLSDATTEGGGQPESTPQSGYLYSAPLVGRSRQIALFQERLTSVGRGQGAKVLLLAEAGLGKTRLVLELIEHALKQDASVFHLECAEPEPAQNQAWLEPVRSLLQTLRDHQTQGLLPSGRAALEACQGALSALDDTRLEPTFASERAQAARETLLQNLTAATLAAGSERTVLLVVDDLHHADDLTREFVRRLAARDLQACRLLLVCTAGAERAAEDAPLLELFETVTLGRLNEAEVDLAVRSMLALEHPSPSLIDGAYRVSGGNPFVLGHYLRALIKGRVLRRDRHRGFYLEWPSGELQSGPSQIQLESLRTGSDETLLHWRIQALSAEAARLASIAALMNTSFESSTLAQVARVPEVEAEAVLSELCGDQILERQGDRFRMSDANLAQLLVARLDAAEVKRVHRRAAAVLRLTTPRVPVAPSVLAFHLSRCGCHRKAAHSFANAGRWYLQAYRRRDALDSFESALRELGQLSTADCRYATELSGWHEELADVAASLRQYAKATSAYEQALSLESEPLRRARLYRKLANAQQGDRARAMQHLERAIETLGGADQADSQYRPEWIQIHLDTMWIHYWRQETSDLLRIAQRIGPDVQAFGSDRQRASLDFNLAVGLMQHHRYVTGPTELAHVERALGIYESLGDRSSAAMCRFMRSMILLFAGELDAAELGFEAVLAIEDKATSVTIRVRALTFLCILQRKRRDRERVRKLATSAHSLAAEHNMLEYRGTAMANLAWVAFHDGELAECERLVASAMNAWNASPLNVFRWTGLLPLMATILARGERESDALDLVAIAAGLLDESQQQLPEPLTHELQSLRATRHDSNALARERSLEALDQAARFGLM